ncbi:ribokinase [Candidatus Weimeria sp. HCP3S3_B5]|uniref:ribokinase n=1 Tax=Candidatus Weimeria sp. HCP3S3_B5 TaxID=3438871 RepID=UPI003F895BB8
MKILNFGSLNIDYVYRVNSIVTPGETVRALYMHEYCGGKGLNQSIAIARAGAKVYHAGMIGADGEQLVTMCGASGVDTSYIRTIGEKTGHTIIQVDQCGQNSIIAYGGANQKIDEKFIDEVLADFDRGDILLLQNEISCLGYIIDRAYEKGMGIILNPSPIDDELLSLDLGKISMFILNEVEGFQISGERDPYAILDSMNQKFPKAEVVLTLGEDGPIYSDGTHKVRQKAYKVDAVDTTAAGDTFTGYFVAAISQGRHIKDTLDIASRASALAVTRNGAAPSIPSADEVIEYHVMQVSHA